MIGGQGTPYLEPDHWQFDFGWKYQYSYAHYTGDDPQPRSHTRVKNLIQQLNFGFTYGWDEQTTVTLTVPYVMNRRSTADTINVNGFSVKASGNRNVTYARGIGDVTVSAHRWLFDTQDNVDQNIAIGLGVKLPTGDPEVVGQVFVRDNKGTPTDTSDDVISYQTRPVDSSIQPGNGGWGFPVDIQGFMQFADIFTAYAYGTYMFSPQGTNNVLNGASNNSSGAGNRITNPKSKYMTIADEYLARAGVLMAVPQLEGLSVGLGGRIEGVPAHDLIGPDTGFRRPGYAVSIEPQLVYSHGNDTFALAVPVGLYFNRVRSVPDQYVGSHGDAAFARYIILLNWSHRF